MDRLIGDVAAHVVARVAQEQGPSPTTTGPTTSTDAATTASLSPTREADDDDGGGGGGGNSSHLLFFVALGFGVVFTNLWIIVGVKYCFRYNARNRARMLNEDGEPINLENMPRPHRRRREKKLMSMDEVNEKFPMMKYKSWVSDRAREGLPTTGGVSVPPSRANSLRETEGLVVQLPPDDSPRPSRPSTPETTPTTNQSSPAYPKDSQNEKPNTTTSADDGQPTAENGQNSARLEEGANDLHRTRSSMDDDDEHIDAALPPECLAAPGDSCAICIDTLEDDDDIRGLTCGHAFHAVCVDPWLTSRRACCPLCKADYHTPKPRPNQEGDQNGQNNNSSARDGQRLNLPQSLRSAFFRGGSREDRPRGHGTRTLEDEIRRGQRRGRRDRENRGREDRERAAQTESTTTPEVSQANNGGMLSSVRSALRFGRRRDEGASNTTTDATPADPEVTPSHLESGTRPAQ